MVLDKSFVTKGSWREQLFKDKVVFVTGGSGTICRVQTEALVLLGCRAAIVGRNEKKAQEVAQEIAELSPINGGDTVISIGNVDVREFEQIKRAVATTVACFGRIDFVIAGAAGNFICDFHHLSPNAFKSVISIDLLGSFNTVKACAEQLIKNKGVVVFVSATLHYYGVPFQGPVGSAKAGVDALSNNLAVELGPRGVRFNCIAPGVINGTEGFKRLVPKDARKDAVSRIPLQRMGTTEDIADTTVFLFSPAAKYVTGTTLIVDGGMWHTGTPFAHNLYPGTLGPVKDSKL